MLELGLCACWGCCWGPFCTSGLPSADFQLPGVQDSLSSPRLQHGLLGMLGLLLGLLLGMLGLLLRLLLAVLGLLSGLLISASPCSFGA